MSSTKQGQRIWRVHFTWKDVDSSHDPWMHDVTDGTFRVEADSKEEAIEEGKRELPQGANFSYVEPVYFYIPR